MPRLEFLGEQDATVTPSVRTVYESLAIKWFSMPSQGCHSPHSPDRGLSLPPHGDDIYEQCRHS